MPWATIAGGSPFFQSFPFFSLGIWATWAVIALPTALSHLWRLKGIRSRKGNLGGKFGGGLAAPCRNSDKALIPRFYSCFFVHCLADVLTATGDVNALLINACEFLLQLHLDSI